jgi:3-hydroxyacyl-[acyl-carrier-protein] dehydratase
MVITLPLGIEDVKKYLPHRAPFLFVDSLIQHHLGNGDHWDGTPKQPIELVMNSSLVATYKTDSLHPIFQGHFPGKPIFPGVLQIEMMAQASVFLMLPLANTSLGQIQLDVALLGVDKARFKHPIFPGEQLHIHCKMKRVRNWLIQLESTVYRGENLCSSAEYLASCKFI